MPLDAAIQAALQFAEKTPVCDSQDLTLHTVLSDEVAIVRQTLREAF